MAKKQRKPTAKDYCRTIRDMLKPSMDLAPKDGIVVMFNRTAIERIYDNAKKGARA